MEAIFMNEIKKAWLEFLNNERQEEDWWTRKQNLWEKQKGSIVRVQGKAKGFRQLSYDNKSGKDYLLHLTFLIKQEDHFHLEEQVLPYRLELENNKAIKNEVIQEKSKMENPISPFKQGPELNIRQNFIYERSEAVRYAERWWNSFNPDFRQFEDDCTNYISQCLLAGGAPMRGAPVREQGWWYQADNWSFSWAVAHSLRWYLSGSTEGLKGKELSSPEELIPGDVICYDFEGDDRWDHNTIVVNHDLYGMPLVNAHTNNTRNRYWSYEDSAAWTPNIQYKFFRIGE